MGKSEVWRGGVSSTYTKKETTGVNISHGGVHSSDPRSGLDVRFSLASKGGGFTSIIVWIDPDDFSAIAAEMMKADQQKAKDAFLLAVLAQHA